MIDLDPVDVLHSLKLPIKQLILIVRVLELSENGYVHLVDLRLGLLVQSRMLLGSRHAFFDVFPKLLKINIHISSDRRHLLIKHLFDEPSLDSIQFLAWIHIVNGIYFVIEVIDLFLASVEGFLEHD